MKALLLLLAIPLLSSCALLQTPGRLLQSAGRTFGLSTTETLRTDVPQSLPAPTFTVRATE
jgi:hypothetical protein